MTKNTNRLVGAGVLSAIAASLCCITPVLAIISGASGVASSFSWMEPARPYLIGITILVLGFAWYQKLKPRTDEEIQCACEDETQSAVNAGKPNFWQSGKFLGIVTIFSVIMLAFPHYEHIFYTTDDQKEVVIVNASEIQKVAFEVKGMTCNSCTAHVENDVNKLPGILKVKANYEEATTEVQFDQSKVDVAQIQQAINNTGYKVLGSQ
ncbi:MAG: mercuric transport protein MerTP [Bacteroidales bacterium]|nr:mercuric transport protein MerTP [Bacteroidales bacterium]MDT8430135.1 mercuric transport protein MerTP [Bacteroidales bacterium]